MSQLFKVLGQHAEAIHGGHGTWHLPNGKPGQWMPKVTGPVLCCSNGYHLVELYSLPDWLRADCTIWLAEGKGAKHSDGAGKTAFRQARLIRQLHISDQDLRLFAADCAEHVLPLFEQRVPGDDRPRKAIVAARAFARGEIADRQRAAAGDAAWAAAWAAAGDAAWAAAWAAARAAAGAAARAAAWDAARDAARAAAWAAARAAAGAAARAAAGAAAWDAERKWQSEQLATYLQLEVVR